MAVRRPTWPSTRRATAAATLRAVLPHHHAEARLPQRLRADWAVAADRHADVHLLRLAERPHRTPENHPGGLPDRGHHLLPAVRGADALRQPRPRGVPGEEQD